MFFCMVYYKLIFMIIVRHVNEVIAAIVAFVRLFYFCVTK